MAVDPWNAAGAGAAPTLLQDLPPDRPVPVGTTLRRTVMALATGGEVFVAIATPTAPGPHPGLLVLHGGRGGAEVDKALAWAERGYVAVAPVLPGIADPTLLHHTTGRWNGQAYGAGRWTAAPDARASTVFDAATAAVQALNLLAHQPTVDPDRLGVTGISWGGYLTLLVSSLAGPRVRAACSVFGSGFARQTIAAQHLDALPPAERDVWVAALDAGPRLGNLTAATLLAGATNDFFFFPGAVQATADGLSEGSRLVWAANADHALPVPGGMVPAPPPPPSVGPVDSTQRLPTPLGSRGHWLAMEIHWFAHHLQDTGPAFPRIGPVASEDPQVALVEATPGTEVTWWGAADRVWRPLMGQQVAQGRWHATLPDDVTRWFASASDARPVTVSTGIISTASLSRTPVG